MTSTAGSQEGGMLRIIATPLLAMCMSHATCPVQAASKRPCRLRIRLFTGKINSSVIIPLRRPYSDVQKRSLLILDCTTVRMRSASILFR